MYSLISGLNIKDIPNLDVNTRMGRTDYIDFITPEDMTHNVMRGRDYYNRPFLAIKVNVQEESGEKYEAVGTFFQRYSDSHSNVAYGTCFPKDLIFDDSRVRSEEEIQIITNRINKLLSGETVFNYDYWRYSDYTTERTQGNGKIKIWIQHYRELATKPIENFTYPDIKKCIQAYM